MSDAEMCGFVFVTSLAVSVYNLFDLMKPAFNRALTIAFFVTLALPVVLMLIPAMSAAFGTVLSLKVIALAALSFAVCMIAGLVFKRRFAKATRINKRKTKPIEK